MSKFEEYLVGRLQDPTFQAAFDAADALMERSYTRLCPFGNCTMMIDPLDGQIHTSMGPVGCPCDELPGWRSSYYDGLPKPAVPVKAVGRHGSRVQRSRARRR